QALLRLVSRHPVKSTGPVASWLDALRYLDEPPVICQAPTRLPCIANFPCAKSTVVCVPATLSGPGGTADAGTAAAKAATAALITAAKIVRNMRAPFCGMTTARIARVAHISVTGGNALVTAAVAL